MKKSIKTSILLFLIACFFLSVSVPANAMGRTKTYNWNGFIYVTRGTITEKTVSIVDYRGKKTKITLPSKIDGKRVESINYISKRNNLQEMTIPNGIFIESGAFSRCHTLKKVNLSKHNPNYMVKNKLILTKDGKSLVTTLGSIKHPKIPESVSIIQIGAFQGSQVQKVHLGKNISYLSSSAFENCQDLSHVTFHKDIHLRKMGGNVFWFCISLKTITIPDSVENFDAGAFYGCRNLETLIAGKSNADFSFEDDTPKLRELYFYRDNYDLGSFVDVMVESVSEQRWISKAIIYGKENSNLMKEAKRAGLQTASIEVGCHGAKKWENFEYIVSGTGENQTASIVSYNGTEATISIPEMVDQIPVKTVEDLGSPTCLKEVYLPDSVTVKGAALSSCRNLEKINISSTNPNYQMKNKLLLRKDGETIVAIPGSITHPKIPKSVRNIADGAFFGSSIQKITIGKNIRYIGYKAFKNCDKLTSVTFDPKSTIKILRNSLFENCSSLTAVELPRSITEIWHSVFYNCKNLETLKIKDKVTYFGLDVIAGCDNLQKFYMESKDCKIQDYNIGSPVYNFFE